MRHSYMPPTEQKKLKRLYRVRAAVVALFMISVAGLIGVASLFPAYMFVRTEEKSQLDTVASLKEDNTTSGIAKIERELKEDSSKLTIVSAGTSAPRLSKIIEIMLGTRGNVMVSSIVIGEVSSTTASIIMQGNAPTRESLLAFKTRIESLSVGTKVELPISGFARSKDIPFSLRVHYVLL